jgi:transposase
MIEAPSVSKYCDHLPLNRQSGIYARQGVDLDRLTMADWVGRLSWLVTPIAEAIGGYARAGPAIHADDTPVPVLEPGRGSTRSGRLWVVVRDEQGWGSRNPPAAYHRYSTDRKGVHAQMLLAPCAGFLHADAYAGFARLWERDPITGQAKLTEVACWVRLWMPPLLQGDSEHQRHDKRLQSSIRPSRGVHPASPAVMVRSADQRPI